MEHEVKLNELEGGITEPLGFRATGVSCGLKEGGYKDIGLIISQTPCITACLFTKNSVKAAPVALDISRSGNLISAIIVNSGNANCLTGNTGNENALNMASRVEDLLSLEKGSVMVASTGVIGQKLIMNRVNYGIDRICSLIKTENNYKNFSSAIMTTDKKMKNCAYEFELNGRTIKIGGSAKGSGMIKPFLEEPHATMLVFLTTDALITGDMLKLALKEAADLSFNRISVDNDTSTNDSVFLMSNGAAGNTLIESNNGNFKIFKQVLTKVCQMLARLIVKDGEGASKFINISVVNAERASDAEKAARAIGDSFLVKTALYGQNPNWGRIIAALGYSNARFEIQKLSLKINDLVIFENGDVNRANESLAAGELLSPEIRITLDLGIGKKKYFLWTSDLTCDYVKINANYIS